MIASPDLSDNDPEKTRRVTGGLTQDVTGAENHGTIITIAESPLDEKILMLEPTTAWFIGVTIEASNGGKSLGLYLSVRPVGGAVASSYLISIPKPLM